MTKYKMKNINPQLFAGEITDSIGDVWVANGVISFDINQLFI